ncbi:MAG: hypothetical protein KGM99_10685 [Burkholderiales bacterium]|nr:hypothetical protein [Burkholderiales bacterium]
MSYEQKYWFPAKRYGWGWGIPTCWQGWLVLGGFIALISAGAWIFPPHLRPVAYLCYVSALSVVLVFICWKKGEPPQWRWGEKE